MESDETVQAASHPSRTASREIRAEAVEQVVPPRSDGARVDCALVDAFIAHLEELSVTTIFGVPGGLLHPFFDAVERQALMRLMVTKNEAGAAFMADGYARTSHTLGVCAATSGPGATNLITGVGVAFSDGVPLLVLTGQAASDNIGRGAVQESGPHGIDIVSMFEPVTKYSAAVERPERFLHHLRRALRRALTGRPGPVHLNVPVDFWAEQITYEPLDLERYQPSMAVFDPLAVDEATAALQAARRPLILAGGGVRVGRAQEALARLVARTGARVVTTPRGKGVFAEDHPRWFGVCGYGGHESAARLVLGDQPDVLLAVGASLNETTTFGWSPDLMPSEAFIHVDIDPERIGRSYPVDIGLVGDAATILDAICDGLDAAAGRLRREPVWSDDPGGLVEQSASRQLSLCLPDEVGLTPEQWRADLSAVLPDDAIIFSDVGGHMLFNIHHLRIGADQDFVLNLGFGSMGHGTAAPIGAALAEPDRPVVAIIGDACFTMNGMELLVAVEHDIPVIWIVENNQMHGISWHVSKMISGRPLEAIANDKPVAVADIGRALGLNTYVVEGRGQIQRPLLEALEHPGPTLIDVRVDPTVPPPMEGRAKAIGGFR
jgi:acetolactate synthase I/II/III large subunit